MKHALERLINLLALLLTASRPVTAEQIRYTIPGYSQDSDEAFHRMFERDKDLLRGIGIPLEKVFLDAWDVDHGYLVDPEKYTSADPGLTDPERTALLLAAQVVRLGGAPTAPGALLKLGGARLTGAAEPLAADLEAGPALADLFEAVSLRKVVTFRYREKDRRVGPYGLGHRRGHWYLAGVTDQGERIFRVDRMDRIKVGLEAGAFIRPPGFRMATALADLPWEAGSEASIEAEVRFDGEVAWWAARQLGATAVTDPTGNGDMVAKMLVANQEAFLGWILAFGDKAEVLSPPALRNAVIKRVQESG
jgi:proteasome accessory factor B